MSTKPPTHAWQRAAIAIAALLALTARAQFETSAEGIALGSLRLKPYVEANGAHDNRVVRSADGGSAEGDLYAEGSAGAELRNAPSRYDLAVRGHYGYRAYGEYNELNDDFYTLAASIKTDDGPLLWDVSSVYAKSLNYNLAYNPDTGQEPDSVLTDQSNTRLSSRAGISYDSSRLAKTALVPGYVFQHYFQEYDYSATSYEWMIHNAILKLRRQYTPKTRLYGGAVYSLQDNETETGAIGTLGVGIDHRVTAKTALLAELGYAVADYEVSGTDQSMVSNLRGSWQATPKIGTYVFGGNQFMPGYSGSAARMVYRLGYGASWQVREQFGLRAAILHDYQEQIGDAPTTDPSFGTLRNFFDLKAQYEPIDRLSLIAGLRVNDDQYDPAQTIISLKAVYRFY